MEYTYQPGVTTRNSGLFSRSAASSARKARAKVRERQEAVGPVKEVVLGKSLLARFGYWLLMRKARSANPSHNTSGRTKKTKVTRSVLRQNRVPTNILSVVSPGGRRNLIRIENERTLQTTGASAVQKDIKHKSGKTPGDTLPKRVAIGKNLVKPVQAKLGVSQINKGSGKKAVHCEKKYEQDQFVKTERNIAAAMKEAQKGISAEQLVIRFGLSVPEAGLIASMYRRR